MNSFIRKYNITFFCLYGKDFGYGHYSRIKSFVKKIKKKVNLVTFGDKIKDLEQNFNNYNHFKSISEFNIKKIDNKKNSLAILDLSNYNFISKNKINYFFKKINKSFNKIIIIDSIFNESFYDKVNFKVDCLIIPYFVSKSYKKKFKGINFLTFPDIFFCNENLLSGKKLKTKKIQNCLISLGSTDSKKLNLELIKILGSSFFKNLNFTFILGKFLSSNYKKELIKKIKDKKNIKLEEFNSKFFYFLKKTDLILSSSGITKYEALIIKKPNIRIYRNLNEQMLDYEFSKRQNIKSFNLLFEKLLFKNYFKKLVFNENFSKKILDKNFKMLNNIKVKNINNIDVRI